LTCIFQSFFSPPAATCWLPVAPRRGEGASYLSRPFFTWSQTESQHFVSRTCNGSTAPVLLQPFTQVKTLFSPSHLPGGGRSASRLDLSPPFLFALFQSLDLENLKQI
jgi:hypothetical protein